MSKQENEKLDDFEENETHELVGDCVAYMKTGFEPVATRVEYRIKYQPTGELRDNCPPEHMSRPLDEGDLVILINPLACKKDVLQALSETSKMISDNGLYLGDWPTYDPNNPYQLFDQGGRVVGKPEG